MSRSLHCVQSLRASRWATTQSSADADEEGLDAHLGQPGDGARRVVGVQGREHQVAGERGLDGDLAGLVVADLTDQDDVGVGAQDRAQAGGEVRPALLLRLTWLMPASRYSTGSSTVMIVDLGPR